MTSTQFNKELGQKIRAARKAKRLTATYMAKKFGCIPSSWSYKENGKVSIKVVDLVRIAGILGVDVTELIPNCPDTTKARQDLNHRIFKTLSQYGEDGRKK